MGLDPVVVSPPPQLKAATVVWRNGGKLYATVIVKQSFLFEERGARPTGPKDILREEVDEGRGRVRPDELAPCLGRADVWATGHARGTPGVAVDVALTVRREGALLLEKRTQALAEADGRAFLGGLGPISKAWPARARRLGGVSRSMLEGSVIAVPETIDWAYFQASPAEQQVPHLAPRDEIALDLLAAPGAPPARLAFTIPRDVPRAIVAEPNADATAFTLHPDTAWIDIDAGLAHVLYRGRVVLTGEPGSARAIVTLDDESDLALAGTLQAQGEYQPPLPPPRKAQ